jgi:cytochrome P450
MNSVRFEPRSAETWRDPFSMYSALRDHDPVHEVHDPQGDYWVLSRFGDVMRSVIDARRFSSAEGLTMTYGEMGKLGVEAPIVMMDPPQHTKLRKLSIKRFTPKQVQAIEALVRRFVVERVEELREAGEGDVVERLFKPLPSLVVGHFLGVPAEDQGQFDGWTDGIVAANARGDILNATETVGQMFGYFAGLIEKRRQDPVDDMISTLVHAEIDGEPIPMTQILGMCFTMVTGGNDTTTGLLGGAAQLLTENPAQRVKLLRDRGLLPGALEEFLRLTSPVQGLARMTTEDVCFETEGGTRTIPEGRKVMLLYASANRDEREFGEDAGACDLTRRVRRHLSFGYGPHHCIGAAAARLQARIALEELLARCPEFVVFPEQGRFAEGHFVRRYESLPFAAKGAA